MSLFSRIWHCLTGRTVTSGIPQPQIDTSSFTNPITAGSTVTISLTNLTGGTQYQVQFVSTNGTPVAGCSGTVTASSPVPPPPEPTVTLPIPTTPPTNYYLEVSVANPGSGQDFINRVPVTVNPATGAPSVSLNASPPTPSTYTNPVTFTATASGGSGTYSGFNWYLNGMPTPATLTIPPPPPNVSTYTHRSTGPETYSVTVTVTDSTNKMSGAQSISYTASC